jgi:hypothetical protein
MPASTEVYNEIELMLQTENDNRRAAESGRKKIGRLRQFKSTNCDLVSLLRCAVLHVAADSA